MMAPTHGIAVVLDGLEDFIKDGLVAAMGGDDGELAAPGGARLGDAIEFALLAMDGELVELDVAGFADESVGVGGQGKDAAAGFEAESERAQVLAFVEDLPFGFVGGQLKCLSPALALAQIFAGGGKIAGGDPDVEAGVQGAGFANGVEGIGGGQTNLATLFDNPKRGGIIDPAPLIREKETIFHKG